MRNSQFAIVTATIALVLLTACSKKEAANSTTRGADIPTEFLNKAIAFGDDAEQVVKGMEREGFKDAAGQPEMNFDSVPDNMGNNVAMKAFSPTDTTGFDYESMKWDKVQVQLDQKGLFSVIFFSKPIDKQQLDQRLHTLLKELQRQNYPLAATKIGQSMLNGDATDIMGYRYEQNGRLMQLHSNDIDGQKSIIVLIFNKL